MNKKPIELLQGIILTRNKFLKIRNTYQLADHLNFRVKYFKTGNTTVSKIFPVDSQEHGSQN